MSWVSLALGLIRNAAATEQGQEIIQDLKSGAARSRPPDSAPTGEDDVGAWRHGVNRKLEVTDRNVAMLVGMLNTQNEAIVRIQKRQRIWNVALGAAVLIAIAVPVLGWLFLR